MLYSRFCSFAWKHNIDNLSLSQNIKRVQPDVSPVSKSLNYTLY